MKMLMKLLPALGLAMFISPAMADEHGGGLIGFNVQAGSFSDSAVRANGSESCAHYLKVLLGSEKYKLLDVTGVQGPPGVVYTLQNQKGEIAIVKCRIVCVNDIKPPAVVYVKLGHLITSVWLEQSQRPGFVSFKRSPVCAQHPVLAQ